MFICEGQNQSHFTTSCLNSDKHVIRGDHKPWNRSISPIIQEIASLASQDVLHYSLYKWKCIYSLFGCTLLYLKHKETPSLFKLYWTSALCWQKITTFRSMYWQWCPRVYLYHKSMGYPSLIRPWRPIDIKSVRYSTRLLTLQQPLTPQGHIKSLKSPYLHTAVYQHWICVPQIKLCLWNFS